MTEEIVYFTVSLKRDYKLLGTGAKLDKRKAYWAMDATNQPDWKSKGLIFVLFSSDGSPAEEGELDNADGFLLGEGDYKKID